MIIDKETGNIIFETGETLKSLMTLDEVKSSSIMNLLRESSITEMNETEDMIFKPFTYYGSTVYIRAVMSAKEVVEVTICLDEAANFYEDPYYEEKFSLYKEKHINFIKKILSIDEFETKKRFKWGFVNFSANARSAYMKIEIIYYFNDDIDNLC